MSQLDEYAKSRQREDELAPIEQVVGPQVANEIGNMRQQEYEAKQTQGKEDKLTSAWDYVVKPVQVGLELLHDFSTHYRGLLVNKEFAPVEGKDVVKKVAGKLGFDYTPADESPTVSPELQKELLTGAWYKQAFPALFVPLDTWKRSAKWALELGADIATDPIAHMFGPAGVAAKGVARAAEAVLPKVKAPVAQARPQAATPSVAEAVPAQVPPITTDLKLSNPKLSEGELGFKQVNLDLLDENAIAHPDLVNPEKVGAIRESLQAGKAETIPPVQVSPGEGGRFNIVDGRHRVEAAKQDGYKTVTVEVVPPKKSFAETMQKEQLAEVETMKLPLREAPTPVLAPGLENAQATLEGFGRYIRGPLTVGDDAGRQLTIGATGEAQKTGQLGLTGVTRPKEVTEKISTKEPVVMAEKLTGKQLTLALRTTIDLDKKLLDMRKHVEEATLNDLQRRVVAQHLLDTQAATPWSIMAKPQMDIPHEAWVVAENAINRSVVDGVERALVAWKKAPDNDALREKVVAELAFAFDVNKKMLASKAERGAVLRAEKTSQDPAVTSFQDFFQNMAEGTTLERAAYALDQLKTAKSKADFVKSVVGLGPGKGTVLQHMLNGLIAGTGTPIWNFAAGTALFGAKVFERWRMQGFSELGLAPHGASTMMWAFTKSYIDLMVAGAKLNRNLTPAQAGAVERFGENMEKAKEIFTQAPHEMTGKLNARRSISAKAYGAEDHWFSPAIDYYGHLINIPSYMVGASDAFLQFAVRQAAMETRALDEAYAQVAAAASTGKTFNKHEAGKLVQARREELMKNPDQTFLPNPETGKMTSLTETGRETGDLMAMMTRLKSGTFGASVDKATSNSVIARAIAPFFRVAYLSGREAIIRTPILNKVAPSVRADLEAGGYRAAKASAQLSTGYALATVGASLTALGFMEGDGPTDPEANKMWRLNHTPGTIGFPGTREGRIPYTRLGPIGQLLRVVANTTDYMLKLPDSEVNSELALGLAGAVASVAVDEQFNRDIHDLFSALASHDKAAFDRWVDQKTGMVLPYSALVRQVNRQLEGEVQVHDGLWEKIKSGIPGYNGITYYNELGRKDLVPNDSSWDGILNNTGFSNKANLDPMTEKVLNTLDANRVTFAGPDRTHEGVRMTMQEYMDLRKLFGEVKGPSGTLIEGINKLVNSSMWERGVPGPGKSRQTMLSSVVSSYREAAFNKFVTQKDSQGRLVHEDFVNQYMRARAERFRLVPPGSTP